MAHLVPPPPLSLFLGYFLSILLGCGSLVWLCIWLLSLQSIDFIFEYMYTPFPCDLSYMTSWNRVMEEIEFNFFSNSLHH